MSAPLAGKFSDHYEVLGIDPKADAAQIKATYEALAKKYSPTNPITGSKQLFAELNGAYEILSDPQLRKAFDAVRGGNAEEDDIQFPVQDFLDELDSDAGRRMCLLTLLYHRRKANTISPGISLRQVESVMKVTTDQLGFMMWMLKQQGLAMADDKSRLLITVTGIEFIEANRPAAADITPWLRSSNEQEAMRPVAKTTPAKAAAPVAPQAPTKAPLREAPPLTGQGMATAGLSSLRTALQHSIGASPVKKTPAHATETEQEKATGAKR
jgi:curved DNA-binding protein